MSTRCATIVMETMQRWGGPETNELMRFYRHCDGYPAGQGADLAIAVKKVNDEGIDDNWCQRFLAAYMAQEQTVEVEPKNVTHDNLEYLYTVHGIQTRCDDDYSYDYSIEITVYGIGWDESYESAMAQEPLFKGSAAELLDALSEGKLERW